MMDSTATLEVPGTSFVADGVRFPFRLGADGVFFCTKSDEEQWDLICSRLEVLAVTRDEHGEDWGRLLRVTDPDGNAHEWAMPMRMLAGDGADLRARLADLGLEISPGRPARDRLHSYLTVTKPPARVRCVSRIGWHGESFVLPDAVLGDGTADPVRLQVAGPLDHAFRSAGSLDQWQHGVAAPCENNSRLVLALCAAFSGPALELIKAESGGFHLRGASSIGKTTALLVAGSVFGGGGLRGYIRQWRATANGLEGVAVGHCDVLLCLDELSQVDAREAGTVAYMLANGQGKSRASRDGSARRAAEWRLIFLSTGELGLADKVSEDGRGRATAGQGVRVLDVAADAGRGLGLFEDLGSFANAASLAAHLKKSATSTHGVAGRVFLAALVRTVEAARARLREGQRRFIEDKCPAGADGQVRRAADRFGLLAAAGELAIEFGVLPWQPGSATAGVSRCFTSWLEDRGTLGPVELADGVDAVRGFLAKHGSARFESLEREDGDRVPNRAGWCRLNSFNQREYYVLPSVFKSEIARGFDPKALARELVEQGLLLPDSSGKTSQSVSIPGVGKTRLYHFAAAVVADDD